ncbi:MAG TPA: hypothetical protein VGB59_12855 [Allosphingosinicella sp.]|jgi:hypothetical protein
MSEQIIEMTAEECEGVTGGNGGGLTLSGGYTSPPAPEGGTGAAGSGH